MASMKDIKNRIKSVESTMQITKAMELVAVSKLRRAKEKISKSRPYFEILRETIDDIEGSLRDDKLIFSRKREKRNACFIVIGGDRGLAGGYNQNLFKLVQSKSADFESLCILPVGKKVSEFFTRRSAKLLTDKFDISEDVNIADCSDMARMVCEAFEKKEIDSVFVFYTNFTSMLTQQPMCEEVLPLVAGKGKDKNLTLYEPEAEEVLSQIVPLYISGMIYGALCEARASEYAARQSAMNSANKNAEEMIDDLTLGFNRARQAAITQEITEIVAGSQ